MKKWQTLRSEYVFKTPFGNLRKDQCVLPDGQVINDYYVNEYADWVNAVVLTKDKKAVLVKQYRHAAQDLFLEIPAGKPEGNESYKEAILREIREETGFTSDQTPVFLGKFFVNPATQTNQIAMFLFKDAYEAYDQDLDPTEFIDVELVDFDSMETMIQNGEINQFFTASAYYMAKDRLRK